MDYESPQGHFKGQIDDFPRVTGLLSIEARLHCPRCFYFICRASRRPVTRIKVKFVARQSFSGNTSNKTRICCRK